MYFETSSVVFLIQGSCKRMQKKEERVCSLFGKSCCCSREPKSSTYWRTAGIEGTLPSQESRQQLIMSPTSLQNISHIFLVLNLSCVHVLRDSNLQSTYAHNSCSKA